MEYDSWTFFVSSGVYKGPSVHEVAGDITIDDIWYITAHTS